MTNDWVLGMASAIAFDTEWVNEVLLHLQSEEHSEVQRLIEQSADAIHVANSDYFRFNVDGVVGIDEPMMITMSTDESTATLGLGLSSGHSDRKLLALVILRVEGTSPTIRLDGHDKSVAAQPGQLVVVPSYCSLSFGSEGPGSVVAAAFHAFGRAFR